jgi:hypothetical protein
MLRILAYLFLSGEPQVSLLNLKGRRRTSGRVGLLATPQDESLKMGMPYSDTITTLRRKCTVEVKV